MKFKRFNAFMAAILLAVLPSCNLPSQQQDEVATLAAGEPVLTVAARTVAAQLTADAGLQPAVTPAPSVTPPLFLTPTTTHTPSPLVVTRTPQPVVPTSVPCDQSSFISDVSVPDNTTYVAKRSFTKTWRLKNSGNCAWTTTYAIAFTGGDLMSAPTTYTISAVVAPGQTVDISLPMKAPKKAGTYKGNWRLKNSSGVLFGDAFYVQIKVVAPSPTPTPTDEETSFTPPFLAANDPKDIWKKTGNLLPSIFWIL